MTLRPLILAGLTALALPTLALPAFVVPVLAQTSGAGAADSAIPAPIAELFATLRMPDTLEIMRLEGLDYGAALDTELLGGRGGADWAAAVARIYDAERNRAAFEVALAEELGRQPDLLAPMQAFFGSDQGQRILALEIEARRALLDESVEDAARVTARQLQEDKAPLAADLSRFIAAGDLVERNVAGALTSSLAFYEGMASQGPELSRQDMMAMVWAQEEEIRSDTEAWLMGYLALAYQPLPPGDLDAYIAFSESDAGVVLNAALFGAYGQVFSGISRDLGEAAALRLVSDDI